MNLPWSVEEWPPGDYAPRYIVRDSRNVPVCECHQLFDGSGQRDKYPDGVIRTPAQSKEQARRIVASVNLLSGYRIEQLEDALLSADEVAGLCERING